MRHSFRIADYLSLVVLLVASFGELSADWPVFVYHSILIDDFTQKYTRYMNG